MVPREMNASRNRMVSCNINRCNKYALRVSNSHMDLKSHNPGTSTSLSDRDFMKIRSLSGVETNMLDGIIAILRIAAYM